MQTIKAGDFVVEKYGTSCLEEFGVVTAIHEEDSISVRFPHVTFYTFASYCQPYQEWLDELGF